MSIVDSQNAVLICLAEPSPAVGIKGRRQIDSTGPQSQDEVVQPVNRLENRVVKRLRLARCCVDVGAPENALRKQSGQC